MTTYRRRQGNTWPREGEGNSQNRLQSFPSNLDLDVENSSSSLAAKAIRASSAYRDSSLSSAYSEAIFSPTTSSSPSASPLPKGPVAEESTFSKTSNDSKPGFWGALAKKAKAILEDDNMAPELDRPGRNRHWLDTTPGDKNLNQYHSPKHHQETEGPALQKGLGALATSLNSIGGAIGNALEEGLTVVENRTADIIQETRKLQIRRKAGSSEMQKQPRNIDTRQQQTAPQIQKQHIQNAQDIQLKASRDVAMAMAAKAKLLLRELKTVKADLAFAKERCSQLEEENRMLRQNHGKGDNLEDDDLIRLQLETLLAEKARLAQENLVYARENRFLKEVVEYHQLTMQDVVYLDEGKEEVTEVCPLKLPMTTKQQSFLILPPDSSRSAEVLQSIASQVTQDVSSSFMPSEKIIHVSHTAGEPKLR